MLINPFYAPDNSPCSQTLLLSFVYDNHPESLSSSVSCFSFSDEDYCWDVIRMVDGMKL